MNTRQAILKAADQIDRTPDKYDFGAFKKATPDCGTPACMLGWIGLYAGAKNMLVNDICEEILGVEEHVFYDRIRAINQFGFCATLSAQEAAAMLRAYADKHHPAESRALIPDSVARIFRMSHAELVRELKPEPIKI